MEIQAKLISELKKQGCTANVLKSPYTKNTYYVTAGKEKDIITTLEINIVTDICKANKTSYFFDTQRGFLVVYKQKAEK